MKENMNGSKLDFAHCFAALFTTSWLVYFRRIGQPPSFPIRSQHGKQSNCAL